MQAIILAGGAGTRLRGAVSVVPKPLAPIKSRPFLEILFDYLAEQGFSDILLTVGYMAQSIVGHFGNKYRGIGIRYLIEDQPLGTGGAIKHALNYVSDNSVFIVNGDTFLRVDYRAVSEKHHTSGAMMTMVLKRVEDTSRFGRVRTKGDRVLSFENAEPGKAGTINTGVYLVSKELFERYRLPNTFSFEQEFLLPHVRDLHPLAYFTKGYFRDIGVPEDYLRAQDELGG
jgi:D-glycero-alpha-D-manno-heptose 1-phosphate guanylyltransferase